MDASKRGDGGRGERRKERDGAPVQVGSWAVPLEARVIEMTGVAQRLPASADDRRRLAGGARREVARPDAAGRTVGGLRESAQLGGRGLPGADPAGRPPD